MSVRRQPGRVWTAAASAGWGNVAQGGFVVAMLPKSRCTNIAGVGFDL